MATSIVTNRPHPPRTRAAGAVLSGLAAATAALLVSACATAPQRAATPPTPIQPPSLVPVSGSISGSAASIDFRPFGAIPTDGITLPVLSPNGRYMAVQTGAAPDLATALARPGQRPPLASRIALYRIDPRGLVRLGETDGGLVLGRNADDRGVLVEGPQTDGTRWIGRLDWNNLEPEWLVQDGNVNAFAALGADGMLAYSARPVTSTLFDLVVRKGDSVRRLDGDGTRSYLFPALSADAATVFALVLRDGILELGSADPASGETLKQSLARAFVTDRGTGHPRQRHGARTCGCDARGGARRRQGAAALERGRCRARHRRGGTARRPTGAWRGRRPSGVPDLHSRAERRPDRHRTDRELDVIARLRMTRVEMKGTRSAGPW